MMSPDERYLQQYNTTLEKYDGPFKATDFRDRGA